MSKKILLSDDDPIKNLIDNSQTIISDVDKLNDLPINANQRKYNIVMNMRNIFLPKL